LTSRIFSFEDSIHRKLFQYLGIPLCHGWILDPVKEGELLKIIKNLSYNEVTERIAIWKEKQASQEQNGDSIVPDYNNDGSCF
jgi:hypothetical protein